MCVGPDSRLTAKMAGSAGVLRPALSVGTKVQEFASGQKAKATVKALETDC
jgi:chemotaxis receptor (MCP) glutamine deamidase CheD